jgi:predicted transposase YbfD/YdcC
MISGPPPKFHGTRDTLVRGARTGEQRPVHLLAAFEAATGVVLGQCAVDGKTNEINAFALLLDRVDFAGVILTADALHTQVKHVVCLHGQDAHWILTVTDGCPGLRLIRPKPVAGVGPLRALTAERGAAQHVASARISANASVFTSERTSPARHASAPVHAGGRSGRCWSLRSSCRFSLKSVVEGLLEGSCCGCLLRPHDTLVSEDAYTRPWT